jgi:hypothetical protein
MEATEPVPAARLAGPGGGAGPRGATLRGVSARNRAEHLVDGPDGAGSLAGDGGAPFQGAGADIANGAR